MACFSNVLHIAPLTVLSASKDVGPFMVCSKILRKKTFTLPRAYCINSANCLSFMYVMSFNLFPPFSFFHVLLNACVKSWKVNVQKIGSKRILSIKLKKFLLEQFFFFFFFFLGGGGSLLATSGAFSSLLLLLVLRRSL